MARPGSLHGVSGRCDLCDDTCDSETQELNVLSCTFSPNCPEEASCYHQECLEKYLKNIRCEKNRKTGFKCPRGCGKGSQYPDPCPGKIDKSHPIHVRNDNAKKRKKAKMPEPAADAVPRFGPAAKAARAKEQKEREEQEKAKAKAKEKEKAAVAAKTTSAPVPKAKAAAVKKESLLSAAAAARRELGLPVPGPSANGVSKAAKPAAAAPAAAGVRTYEELLASRSARSQTPTQVTPRSVWVASSSPAAASSEPASPSPPPVSSAVMFPPMPAATKAPPAQVSRGPAAHTKPSSSVSEESTGRSSMGQGTAVASRLGSGMAAQSSVPGTSQAEEVPKLSKASRKNMRRAEKKREKEAEASVTSEPSPPLTPHQTPSLAAVPSPVASSAKSSQTEPGSASSDTPAAALPQLSLDGDVLERCLQIVAMYKMRQASLQLQRIGFTEWQAAVAVQLCGCNLHPAVVWLLEGHIGTKAQAQQLMQRKALPKVDVSEEAQQLTAAPSSLGMTEAAICKEVERCQGNVAAALAALAPSSLPVAAAASSGGARQRHQRTFSPLPAGALLSNPVIAPPAKSLRSNSGKLVNSTWDALDPLLDAVLPREVVNGGIGSRPAAQQQPRGSAVGGGILAAGPLYASMPLQQPAGSDSHSRVSSFDMLSVGNPWGDLLPGGDQAADQQHSPKHSTSQLEPRNGFSSMAPQLPSPFGGLGFSQLGDSSSPGLSPASRRSPGHTHNPSSSTFFGSPASFIATSSALGMHPSSALGLEQYASALSSQPSWASTSSNLWGPPTQQDAAESGPGLLQLHQPFQQQQAHQFSDVPAAALLAAAAVASEPEGEHASGSGMALGDTELNALMATLMCR